MSFSLHPLLKENKNNTQMSTMIRVRRCNTKEVVLAFCPVLSHCNMYMAYTVWHVEDHSVICCINSTPKEDGDKAVMSLGNANLIMAYATLSVFFPEDPKCLLAGFVSLW